MSKCTETEFILESDITQEEYLTLRATTTWKQIKPERVAALLKNSAFLVRAKVDGKTVGMARSLFDFGYSVYISDVIVLPEFQGQGIGRKLIEHLIDKAKESVGPDDYLKFILVAAPGKSTFYEKLGFSKRNDQNGWGMVLNYNF